MAQRVMWEVVDNQGEGTLLTYDGEKAFKKLGESEVGTRLVKYRGYTLDDARIVGEWEMYHFGIAGV